MNILCIETSGPEGTLALQRGEQILTARITSAQQAEALIPQIDALLSRAGIGLRALDVIGFGRGPGSFIGVRLATAAAQGLAAAAGIGLVPVSSMAALARQLAPHGAEQRVAVCLDARMAEVYWAEFVCTADGVRVIAPECLLSPQDVHWPEGADWIAGGSGFAAYVELRAAARSRGFAVSADVQPDAVDVLALARAAVRAGEIVAPEHWHGRYLRDETAWKTTQ